jgi:hypothetical protein
MATKTKRIPSNFKESAQGSERVVFDIRPIIHNFSKEGRVVVVIGNCKVIVTTKFIPGVFGEKEIKVSVHGPGNKLMWTTVGKPEIIHYTGET